MFRYLIILAALAATDVASASIPALPRSEPGELLRTAQAVRPTRPAVPYQLDAETVVFLDGQRTDYRSIPSDARIEYMEVTEDGRILTVYFLSPAPQRGR